MDEGRTFAIVAHRWGARVLLSVDLVSGNRSVLSGEGFGEGPSFVAPAGLDFDPRHGRLLVEGGSRPRRVFAVDPTSGDRTLIAEDPSSDWTYAHINTDLVLDDTGEQPRILVTVEGSQLFFVDPVRLTLKTPWADGEKAILLSPMDLIARLAAIVPPPSFHLTRFHGVFAPHSRLRKLVVPTPEHDPVLDKPHQLGLFDEANGYRPAPPPQPEAPTRKPGRHPWQWLLRRVFRVDISVCIRCQGAMKTTEVALTADSIANVMARHGLGPQPPPPTPRLIPGQLPLEWPPSP